MPPWHVGHVIKKLMLAARPKEITRTELAERSGKRPMTITHLLKGGKSDDDTIEAVANVLGVSKAEIYAEVDRSNARGGNVFPMHVNDPRRRATDRDAQEMEADQYARRLLRLANSAQTAVYNTIRALEEAYGLLKSNNNR